ncbi:MAG TPA: Nramp family divalent metal transporter [Thermoanaerobaculia bacterium]|jgi:Mn2+/Fe2+ NRAMP family transporter
MKNILKVTLGILTSIGGFLDAGAIATNASAGANFGMGLLWATALGTLFAIFLVEMSGRLAVVSKHTLADAMREHFGFRYHAIPLATELLVDFLVLTAEIGGACIALQFVTGIPFKWFALPVGLCIWVTIWIGSFGRIEKATAFIGLITICFIVGAFRLRPDMHAIASGFVPHQPPQDAAHYWFLSVSIIGAIITPYVFYFYSSGAIEEKWDFKDLGVNRAVAALGMTFGCIIAMGITVVAAQTLQRAGIAVDRFEQAPLMLTDPFGRWGVFLFAASLAICCFGAAIEVALAVAYVVGQAFGWRWGEDLSPKDNARFAMTYTIFILLAALVTFTGIDPLKVTMFSMAMAVVILPLVILPLLVIMNDEKYLKEQRNGWISNTVGVAAVVAAIILAIVAIPLEIIGGG